MKKLILISLIVLAASCFVNGQDWNIHTVDDEETAGRGTCMWVDDLGYPHILYRNGAPINGTLYYTYWTGSGWFKELVDFCYGVNAHDATVDLSENVHICYFYSSQLKYGFNDGVGWNLENVTSGSSNSYVTSIALDSHGKPHIIHQTASNDLMHSYNSVADDLWYHELIADDEAGGWHSVAIDDNDHIYVAYHSYDDNLKLAYYDGIEWGTQYIDLGTQTGSYCDLILDENDVPHIAYYDETNTRLMYATFSTPPLTGSDSSEKQ